MHKAILRFNDIDLPESMAVFPTILVAGGSKDLYSTLPTDSFSVQYEEGQRLALAWNQVPASTGGKHKVYIQDSTFTIVAVDLEEHEKGVALCTYRPAVGNRAPFARSVAGAVSTQAHTNPELGPRVLDLLAQGLEPARAIDIVLEDDPDRERRQLLCVDAKGQGGAFTGRHTQEWKGHSIGDKYVTGGNMLTGQEVIEAMGSAFEEKEGPLYVRLLAALYAGHDEGGDRRGSHSAALVVARPGVHPYLDLRVDFSEQPIEDLEYVTEQYIKRIFD